MCVTFFNVLAMLLSLSYLKALYKVLIQSISLNCCPGCNKFPQKCYVTKGDIIHGRYITWTGNTNRFTDNRYSIFAALKSR